MNNSIHVEDTQNETNTYCFRHPLNHIEGSKTYFNMSDNIKTDLDLVSEQDDRRIKLYDMVLNNIDDLKQNKKDDNVGDKKIAPLKTKSQQRVYDVITTTIFNNKKCIDANKEIITIAGMELDEKLLSDTLRHQEIIENTLFDRELNSDFYESHNYIDYKPVDFVNRSSKIMGFLNIYTLTTPLISLLMPLFILLIPFLTMRVKGVDLSFSQYFTFLKSILAKIPAFRIFTFSGNDGVGSKISALMGFILYFVQMYYNTKYCARYITKNHDIHATILAMKNTITNSIHITTSLLPKFRDVSSSQLLSPLYDVMSSNLTVLHNLYDKLKCFEEKYSVLSLNHVNTVGHKLKLFYEFISDHKHIQTTLKSIFDLNTFMSYYKNIHTNIENNYMSMYSGDGDTELSAEEREKSGSKGIEFKNVYFPMLLLETDKNSVVKNSVAMDKSYILSGPNASGKTTLLKSALFNILCTQQFGCGFYDACTLSEPFSIIESYINIIDTHDRNSLFQNEARRMLEIIKTVETSSISAPTANMFFVFDELFSGTNPKEATSCGIACLNDIIGRSNVKFILTTHYDGICTYFSQNKYSTTISNKQMACSYSKDVNNETNTKNKNKNAKDELKNITEIHYDYTLVDGVSTIYGGLTVLRDLGFSNSILKKATKIMSNKKNSVI